MVKPFLKYSDSLVSMDKNIDIINYLYDNYAPAIYGLLLKDVGNDEIATKILIATFINIKKECKIEYRNSSLFSWILSITHKTAKDVCAINLNFKSILTVQNTTSVDLDDANKTSMAS